QRKGNSPGDAILLYLGLGILAVADGPERNPFASSLFLKRFSDFIETSDLLSGEDALTNDTFERIVEETNALMRSTGYHENTTFSCLIVGENNMAALLHTGDSLIFLIRDGGKEIVQMSRTNHFMVGRSPNLFQSNFITLRDGDVALLATDGITDLARCHGLSLESFLSKHLDGIRPRGISDNIVASSGTVKVNLDDIGIIVADLGSIRLSASHPGRNKTILNH
ncbi:MAG TPA: SpoIIE family protein phosphatase, partial [Syntrophales bacterium]|nr:SpoIIE family protein phosphatase [Syntrophales bacterium]